MYAIVNVLLYTAYRLSCVAPDVSSFILYTGVIFVADVVTANVTGSAVGAVTVTSGTVFAFLYPTAAHPERLFVDGAGALIVDVAFTFVVKYCVLVSDDALFNPCLNVTVLLYDAYRFNTLVVAVFGSLSVFDTLYSGAIFPAAVNLNAVVAVTSASVISFAS